MTRWTNRPMKSSQKRKRKMSENFIHQHHASPDHAGLPRFYTLKGYEDYLDTDNNPQQKTENNQTQAKAIPKSDGSYRYFIKITGDGKPYNMSAEHTNVRNAVLLKTIGRDQAQYKEVNSKVFAMYLNFLRTKNVSWLHNSEREMI